MKVPRLIWWLLICISFLIFAKMVIDAKRSLVIKAMDFTIEVKD